MSLGNIITLLRIAQQELLDLGYTEMSDYIAKAIPQLEE